MRGFPTTLPLAGLSLFAWSLAAAGQAAPKPTKEAQLADYLADKPAAAQPLFRSAFLEGERNAVLNLDRAGLASLELGDDASAAAAFDKALERIEAVYADNPTAEKARSKFVKEATKDFKGEPYERVMALYYRGILYLRAGDYENARASFGEGQIQDAFAEDQKYKSDYALLEVLSGWASHCNGDEGKAVEFYDHARELRADVVIPRKDDRVILLSDIGSAPEKWADGQYQEALHFRPGTYAETGVLFMSADADLALRSRARAAIDRRVAAEQAEAAAQAAVKDKAAFAVTARALADNMAGDMVSAIRAAASGAPAPASALPPAPPPPASKAAAKKAAADRAAAEQAEVARLAAEKLAVEQAALNAAIAADQAEDDAVAAQGAVQTAHAAIAGARAAEQKAIAALAPVGLSLPADFTAVADIPDAPLLMAAEGDNLFWQANTRGGRQIDGILAGKASFKAGASNFGDGMTQASLIAMQSASSMAQQAQSMAAQGYNVNTSAMKGTAYAGLAFMAVGMISNAVSAAANPAADIRYWDSLPGDLRYASTSGKAVSYRAIFQDQNGRYLRAAPFTVKMDSRGRCGVGWVRTRSAVDVPASAPNSQDPRK